MWGFLVINYSKLCLALYFVVRFLYNLSCIKKSTLSNAFSVNLCYIFKCISFYVHWSCPLAWQQGIVTCGFYYNSSCILHICLLSCQLTWEWTVGVNHQSMPGCSNKTAPVLFVHFVGWCVTVTWLMSTCSWHVVFMEQNSAFRTVLVVCVKLKSFTSLMSTCNMAVLFLVLWLQRVHHVIVSKLDCCRPDVFH